MRPYDASPVTDTEIAQVISNLADAVAVFNAVMDLADRRQIRAVFSAYPWERREARTDFESWASVVLDGTTGLRLPRQCRRAS